jgi:hypothetical protein
MKLIVSWKEKKMPKSPSGPLRRGQLIAPFGVGSMIIVPGGISLIIGGLDYLSLEMAKTAHYCADVIRTLKIEKQ